MLAELTATEKKDESVAHALKLRTAWSLQNYKRFFQTYLQAPKMSGYLIDWFVARERKAALRIIVKAYVLIRTITDSPFLFIILTWAKGNNTPGCQLRLFQDKFHILCIVDEGKYTQRASYKTDAMDTPLNFLIYNMCKCPNVNL